MVVPATNRLDEYIKLFVDSDGKYTPWLKNLAAEIEEVVDLNNLSIVRVVNHLYVKECMIQSL
jgi:hypothetical protein